MTLVVISVAAYLLWPYFGQVELPDLGISSFGSETVRAEVTQITEQGRIELGGRLQNYQVALVQPLEGEYKGAPLEIDYGKRQVRADDYFLAVGDRIMISISRTPDNVVNAYFVDYIRSTPLFILVSLFAIAVLLMSRWKGLRSLIAMAFSLFMIIGYIVPHILAGEDPLKVSILGSMILLTATLYLTYGWNLKSHAAVIGVVFALLLTGGLSGFFVNLARLNGTGDENVMFLMQLMDTRIKLRGLLLGGMIIGALGVLDDLVMTQASAVFELHQVNPALGARGLFRSAMRIGEDHVAATVNTLVLAYAGASLPLFLMFSLARGDYGYLLNFSFIAEEIVRTLVGSIGLIASVPITTLLASFLARRFEGVEGYISDSPI